MTKTRSTKNALISAILVLCMAFTGLLGTTFAWFTDSVTSSGNKIQAGTLKLDLELLDKESNTWKSLKNENDPIFDYADWEPGYTEVKLLKVENFGTLALKWKTVLTKHGEISALANVIDVYVRDYGVLTDAEAAALEYPQDRDLAGYTRVGTAAEFLSTMEETTKGELKAGQSAYLGLALKMRTDAGNEYQGMSLGGTFDITVLASQLASEDDSFDETYDEKSEWPFYSINFTATESVADKVVNNTLLEEVPVGNANGQVSAVVPSGVKMADGATDLELSVQSMEAPTVDLDLEAGETAKSVDVHIEGVAEDNTVPMLVTLRKLFSKGLNSTSVKLYHVEDGTPVEMTQVSLADLDAHNEFNYDPATGDVVMSVASFSEYTVVEDDFNLWEGGFNYDWYVDKSSPYTISTAEQLAGFGKIVDGTAENIEADSFEGKTVKLGADIDLSGGVSFNPIGFGYDNNEFNTNDAAGKVFKGTFDGGIYDTDGNLTGNYIIRNLYQNGWDIGLSYTNAGGGLFASVCDAIIKNLTMVNANIVMECVEQGVIAGLAQGNCTFENINIYGCSVANYQRATGGVVGEVSPKYVDGVATASKHVFSNINIDSTTVIGSLWGDFDAPVGGVIGGYWDDANVTKVEMTNVNVACRLDVYNDITSSYQWHAYRRAGMLIGNTDQPPADGKNAKTATADFLTCEDVTVYYGAWVNYHYCQFSNYNSSWPWVRVEAGENCSAYSNPRYGVPNDPVTGQPVTSLDHNHLDGDVHNLERTFNQLYGGGQGVYGKDEHPNVTIHSYVYTIQYINDNKVLAETYVESNSADYVLTEDPNYNIAKAAAEKWVENQEFSNVVFGGWMNAASNKLTEIPAGNTKNVVLYPYFNSPYTASFVDQNANILAWCLFNDADVTKLSDAFTKAKANLPDMSEDYELVYWKISGTDANGNKLTSTEDGKTVYYIRLDSENPDWESFKGYKDVTITPHYRYKGADLIEVIDDVTGEVIHYAVGGYAGGVGSTIVEIPGYVNGKPVEVVNADAFSSYDDLHSVRIPGTITSIGSQSFTADNPDKWGEQRDTVTLYYEGDPAKWNAAMTDYNNKVFTDNSLLKSGWDNMMGEGSCVFFLDENGKVDLSKGYWELAQTGGFIGIGSKFVWQYHNHSYGSNSGCSNEHNNTTIYTDKCNCNLGEHDRPDAEYWTPATTTEE